METYNLDEYKIHDNPIICLLSKNIELNLAIINDHCNTLKNMANHTSIEDIESYDEIIKFLETEIRKRKFENDLYEKMIGRLCKENADAKA